MAVLPSGNAPCLGLAISAIRGSTAWLPVASYDDGAGNWRLGDIRPIQLRFRYRLFEGDSVSLEEDLHNGAAGAVSDIHGGEWSSPDPLLRLLDTIPATWPARSMIGELL